MTDTFQPARPTPDQLRALAREARNSSGSASDDCGAEAYVLAGWRAAQPAPSDVWTVIAPDGARFTGDTPHQAANEANRQRLHPDPATRAAFWEAIQKADREADIEDARLLAKHGTLDCPACGGSGHVGDTQPAAPQGDANAIATSLCQRVAEFDDRTSPPEYPEMMLITWEELHGLIVEALATQPQQAAPLSKENWLDHVPQYQHPSLTTALGKLSQALGLAPGQTVDATDGETVEASLVRMACDALAAPTPVATAHQARAEHTALVLKHLRPGDVITHTVCLGLVEEHIFTRLDGRWLCGAATKDTRAMEKRGHGSTGTRNDISPQNVTHINRIPVSVMEFIAK